MELFDSAIIVYFIFARLLSEHDFKMYIRVKSTPNSPRKSVQIVASVRKGGKVSQKIVRHVGIAMDDDELSRLQELGRHIMAKIELEYQPSLFDAEEAVAMTKQTKVKEDKAAALMVDLKKLEEEQRCIMGIHDVLGKAYTDSLASGRILE